MTHRRLVQRLRSAMSRHSTIDLDDHAERIAVEIERVREMTPGTLTIPLALFLEQPQLGDEFMCQLRVRVTKLEEDLIDVSSLGEQQFTSGDSTVTMAVTSFVKARDD